MGKRCTLTADRLTADRLAVCRTQNILYDRPDALYISIHRDPSNFYPYHSGFRDELGIGAGGRGWGRMPGVGKANAGWWGRTKCTMGEVTRGGYA